MLAWYNNKCGLCKRKNNLLIPGCNRVYKARCNLYYSLHATHVCPCLSSPTLWCNIQQTQTSCLQPYKPLPRRLKVPDFVLTWREPRHASGNPDRPLCSWGGSRRSPQWEFAGLDPSPVLVWYQPWGRGVGARDWGGCRSATPDNGRQWGPRREWAGRHHTGMYRGTGGRHSMARNPHQQGHHQLWKAPLHSSASHHNLDTNSHIL